MEALRILSREELKKKISQDLEAREGKRKKELLGSIQTAQAPQKGPKKTKTKALEAGNLRAFHKVHIIDKQHFIIYLLSLYTAMGSGVRGSAEATETGAAHEPGRPMGRGEGGKQQTVAGRPGSEGGRKGAAVQQLAKGESGTAKRWSLGARSSEVAKR